MALSVADIVQTTWPSVAKVVGVDYTISPVQLAPDAATYFFYMRDSSCLVTVPVTWTKKDEARADTERRKIELVCHLFRNAINCVKKRLFYQEVVERVEDDDA